MKRRRIAGEVSTLWAWQSCGMGVDGHFGLTYTYVYIYIGIWAIYTYVTLLIALLKVFYGQEPQSGESTSTECGFNYQLLAVIYWSSQWGTPSCSQPQPGTDNGVKEGRSNWLVAPPPSWAVPPERLVHSINQCNLSGTRTFNRSMRGTNHLAYAATQGIKEPISVKTTACVSPTRIVKATYT